MAKAAQGPGRPKTRTDTPTKAAAKNTKPGEERYIIIAKVELIQKMKDLAYWDRMNIKEVYEEAINDRIAKYEKKHGPLKPVPKK